MFEGMLLSNDVNDGRCDEVVRSIVRTIQRKEGDVNPFLNNRGMTIRPTFNDFVRMVLRSTNSPGDNLNVARRIVEGTVEEINGSVGRDRTTIKRSTIERVKMSYSSMLSHCYRTRDGIGALDLLEKEIYDIEVRRRGGGGGGEGEKGGNVYNLHPSSSSSYVNDARVVVAESLCKSGMHSLAECTISMVPRAVSARYYSALVRVAGGKGDVDGAVRSVDEMVSVFPNDKGCYDVIATAMQVAQKEYSVVKRMTNTAISLSNTLPGDGRVNVNVPLSHGIRIAGDVGDDEEFDRLLGIANGNGFNVVSVNVEAMKCYLNRYKLKKSLNNVSCANLLKSQFDIVVGKVDGGVVSGKGEYEMTTCFAWMAQCVCGILQGKNEDDENNENGDSNTIVVSRLTEAYTDMLKRNVRPNGNGFCKIVRAYCMAGMGREAADMVVR